MKNNLNKRALNPEELPNLFVEYWNLNDAKRLSGLFTEDAEFVNVVGLWWHNRKQIFKAHEYGLKYIFSESTLEKRTTKVKYLSDDIAVVHSRFKLIDQSPLGETKIAGSRENIFTFVVHRIEDVWLCVAAHNTDIVPGMETNIRDKEGNVKAVDYRK